MMMHKLCACYFCTYLVFVQVLIEERFSGCIRRPEGRQLLRQPVGVHSTTLSLVQQLSIRVLNIVQTDALVKQPTKSPP